MAILRMIESKNEEKSFIVSKIHFKKMNPGHEI